MDRHDGAVPYAAGPSALASPFTHTELPIELVSEQRVGQLPEVELAEGGHTVDVL